MQYQKENNKEIFFKQNEEKKMRDCPLESLLSGSLSVGFERAAFLIEDFKEKGYKVFRHFEVKRENGETILDLGKLKFKLNPDDCEKIVQHPLYPLMVGFLKLNDFVVLFPNADTVRIDLNNLKKVKPKKRFHRRQIF